MGLIYIVCGIILHICMYVYEFVYVLPYTSNTNSMQIMIYKVDILGIL